MASAPQPERGGGPHRWADFVRLDEDDTRELIDGELLEVEVPTDQHEWIVAVLLHYLVGWVLPRRAGRVHASGYRIRVSDRRGIIPDVQFYRRDNPAHLAPQGLESGRPDLVVEVISPSSRRFDRLHKLQWYAELAVPEYWLVDPESRTLERLVLHDGHYLIAEVLADDAVFRPPMFEGLEIPLAALWAEPVGQALP